MQSEDLDVSFEFCFVEKNQTNQQDVNGIQFLSKIKILNLEMILQTVADCIHLTGTRTKNIHYKPYFRHYIIVQYINLNCKIVIQKVSTDFNRKSFKLQIDMQIDVRILNNLVLKLQLKHEVMSLLQQTFFCCAHQLLDL